MIPIVCSAVAVSACDASSAGLCVVQVFGGGRRAGVRKGGGGREEQCIVQEKEGKEK